MKSTVVEESLSTTTTRVLFQRESTCFYFMFHISSPIVLFLIGRSGMFLREIRIKFHLDKAKEMVKGGMGEKPKMRVIFAKFPLLSKIQTIS